VVKIGRRYEIEASHFLPHVPDGHKCGRMHGHSYVLEVEIEGVPDPHTGWVMDYADIDRIVQEHVRRHLDHGTMNNTVPNPTAENLVVWISEQLHGKFGRAKLCRVRVSETSKSWAELP
jgi:6-pyruvoyltetrahydropterin/6-carboxytetrahydropterin synthase